MRAILDVVVRLIRGSGGSGEGEGWSPVEEGALRCRRAAAGVGCTVRCQLPVSVHMVWQVQLRAAICQSPSFVWQVELRASNAGESFASAAHIGR